MKGKRTLYNNQNIIVMVTDDTVKGLSLLESFGRVIPEEKLKYIKNTPYYYKELHKYPVIQITNEVTRSNEIMSELIIDDNIITKNFTDNPLLINKKYISNQEIKDILNIEIK